MTRLSILPRLPKRLLQRSLACTIVGLAAAAAGPALAQSFATLPMPADPPASQAAVPFRPASAPGSGAAMADMPGMDAPPAQSGAALPGAMAPMQGGRPPTSARDPDAYSGGYQRSTMPNAEAADSLRLGAIFLDQLEAVKTEQGSGAAWDLQAWYGGPFNRAWLRSEGNVRNNRVEDASIEALWFRPYHPFWGSQLGVRQDFGDGPNRTWLAVGVQGATPYWYGMEATAYVGEGGRTAARLKASSDLRFTQRLVLRPEMRANLYGRPDTARGLGSGLATLQTELRLRYELRREFAPYIGLAWDRAFGETQKLRRAATGRTDEVKFLLGVKVWR